jgi:hypothetical protein
MFKKKSEAAKGHFKEKQEEARLNVQLSRDQLIDLKQRALNARMTLREYLIRELKLK